MPVFSGDSNTHEDEHDGTIKGVQDALEVDRERHKRTRTMFSKMRRGQGWSSSSDEDELGIKGLPLSPRSKFKKVNIRLSNVQKLTANGVRHRHLMSAGAFNIKSVVRTKDHEAYIGRILHHGPLMKQTTKILLSKFTTTAALVSADCDKTHMYEVLSKGLADVKRCTANTAWIEHVKPLRDELTELSMKYKLLSEQFKESRTTYLKEVAELRDAVRVRGDPMASIPGVDLDVRWWFEPTQTLEAIERKFLLDLMREKFKMMAENNPRVVRTFDFGQMEKLMEQVESSECRQLREALKRKCDEVNELRLTVEEAGVGNHKRGSQSLFDFGKSAEMQEELVVSLNVQLEEMRTLKDEAKHQLHCAYKSIETMEVERAELSSSLQDESAERIMLQEECEQLRSKLSQESESKLAVEKEKENMEASWQEGVAEIKTLKKTLELLRQQMRGEKVQGENVDNSHTKMLSNGIIVSAKPDPGRLPRLDGDAAAGSSSRAEVVFEDASLHMDDLPKSSVFETKLEVKVSNQDAEVHQLRKECERLRELLREHMEEQNRSEIGLASAEAEDFNLIVESLGCKTNEDEEKDERVQSARVCMCGNVLMEDAKFCRRCGKEWMAAEHKSRRQRITSLSLRLQDVAAELEDAISHLALELKDKQDPCRADRVAEAERKVSRLKFQQKGFETRLMAERTAVALEENASLPEPKQCTCNCFEELELTRVLLRQLQALCAEMGCKIKEATDDNVQLNTALDSTLLALSTAKMFISSSQAVNEDENLKKGLTALQEAEHNAVFHRLFNPNTETKNKWRERKKQLMKASAEAIRSTIRFDKALTAPASTCDGRIDHAKISAHQAPSPLAAGSAVPFSPNGELSIRGYGDSSAAELRIKAYGDSSRTSIQGNAASGDVSLYSSEDLGYLVVEGESITNKASSSSLVRGRSDSSDSDDLPQRMGSSSMTVDSFMKIQSATPVSGRRVSDMPDLQSQNSARRLPEVQHTKPCNKRSSDGGSQPFRGSATLRGRPSPVSARGGKSKIDLLPGVEGETLMSRPETPQLQQGRETPQRQRRSARRSTPNAEALTTTANGKLPALDLEQSITKRMVPGSASPDVESTIIDDNPGRDMGTPQPSKKQSNVTKPGDIVAGESDPSLSQSITSFSSNSLAGDRKAASPRPPNSGRRSSRTGNVAAFRGARSGSKEDADVAFAPTITGRRMDVDDGFGATKTPPTTTSRKEGDATRTSRRRSAGP